MLGNDMIGQASRFGLSTALNMAAPGLGTLANLGVAGVNAYNDMSTFTDAYNADPGWAAAGMAGPSVGQGLGAFGRGVVGNWLGDAFGMANPGAIGRAMDITNKANFAPEEDNAPSAPPDQGAVASANASSQAAADRQAAEEADKERTDEEHANQDRADQAEGKASRDAAAESDKEARGDRDNFGSGVGGEHEGTESAGGEGEGGGGNARTGGAVRKSRRVRKAGGGSMSSMDFQSLVTPSDAVMGEIRRRFATGGPAERPRQRPGALNAAAAPVMRAGGGRIGFPDGGSVDAATQAYFAANPDVAQYYEQNAGSLGMSADQFATFHYDTYGQNEGRSSPTADVSSGGGGNDGGGSPPPASPPAFGLPTPTGYNPNGLSGTQLTGAEEAYLHSNPDVLNYYNAHKADLGNETADQFALQHYYDYGQKEGRALSAPPPAPTTPAHPTTPATGAGSFGNTVPNGWLPQGFNGQGLTTAEQAYLSANPDVQNYYNAHKDTLGESADEFALQHYYDYGQTEGRLFGTAPGQHPATQPPPTGGAGGGASPPSYTVPGPYNYWQSANNAQSIAAMLTPTLGPAASYGANIALGTPNQLGNTPGYSPGGAGMNYAAQPQGALSMASQQGGGLPPPAALGNWQAGPTSRGNIGPFFTARRGGAVR